MNVTIYSYSEHAAKNDIGYPRIALDFFCKHGIYESDTHDFIIVISGKTIENVIPSFHNVKVILRENKGFDFGAWGEALQKVDVDKYTHFFFINCSVIGPFVPSYVNTRDWPLLFTRMIKDKVKLAGTTINIYKHNGRYIPHVQSMVMVTDRVGLDILQKRGVFILRDVTDKIEIINECELGASSAIFDAGYEIDCLEITHHGLPFHNVYNKSTILDRNILLVHSQSKGSDPCYAKKLLFNTSIHPLEVVFMKANRNIDPATLRKCMLITNIRNR